MEPAETPRRPKGPASRIAVFVLVGLVFGAFFYFQRSGQEEAAPAPEASAVPSSASQARQSADVSSELWDTIARSEELILRIERVLEDVAFAISNLELPDDRTRRLFWPFGLEIRDAIALAEEDLAIFHHHDDGTHHAPRIALSRDDAVEKCLELPRVVG